MRVFVAWGNLRKQTSFLFKTGWNNKKHLDTLQALGKYALCSKELVPPIIEMLH